ncbi:MAG: rhomboid family intramembrane serine protease [Rhodobacteraceae bacterium]|nr:rhomboid family intramembrane serine protease [Paracoccaceae bacterium]
MQDQNFEPLPWSIKYIAGVLVALELLLSAGDYGLLPVQGLRGNAYAYGALWPGLVWQGWVPVYPGQSITMLLSHAFLHSGIFHMAMNTVVILALGKRLGAVLSNRQLLTVFGISAVAGGLMFLALNHGNFPVVGASGAVFGFFGVWKYFEFSARKRMGLTLMPIWQFIGTLVLLNVALYFLVSGMLAWEAHLGGFVAGWLLGMVFARRPRQTDRGPHR